MKIECKYKDCKENFKDFHSLYVHIRKIHNISTRCYYDMFVKIDGEGICDCGYPTKYMGLKFGYHKYCSTKCSSNSNEIKKQRHQTYLKTSGYNNPSQNPQIKEKKKDTFKIHYNVDNVFRLKEKIKNHCIDKFGVSSWSETIQGRTKHRQDRIRQIEVQKLNGEPLCPNIGDRERICLNELQSLCGYEIIRNKQILGYFPDGYIEKLNLIIQFDEKEHFLDDTCLIYKEQDIRCTEQLKFGGYTVFRISEKEWNENKYDVLKHFNELCKEIVCEPNDDYG